MRLLYFEFHTGLCLFNKFSIYEVEATKNRIQSDPFQAMRPFHVERCEFDRWWNINAACTRCTTLSFRRFFPCTWISHFTVKRIYNDERQRHTRINNNISVRRVNRTDKWEKWTMAASTATCQQYRFQLLFLSCHCVQRAAIVLSFFASIMRETKEQNNFGQTSISKFAERASSSSFFSSIIKLPMTASDTTTHVRLGDTN